MRIVDLRSDTITKPSPEMWEMIKSMDNSKLGDDVFSEDPTVNELEEKAAGIIGKEAALYVSSGTQGNLVSLLAQTNNGDEILLEEQSHIYLNEIDSVRKVGGLSVQTFPSEGGTPSVDMLTSIIRGKESYFTPTKDIRPAQITLMSLENTHNYHGGAIIRPGVIKDLKGLTEKHNIKFHLDGARIFNAAIGLNVPVTEFTKHVDSIMFCLSKGLSCPVGSLVAGSKEFISKARKFRKIVGGGMRQAGIIAAFGLVALEPKWIGRLKEDHKNARKLADDLKDLNNSLKINDPDTNIVILEFLNKIRILKVVRELNKEGIRCFNIDKSRIRFVTHYGITEEDIEYSIEKIEIVLKKIL